MKKIFLASSISLFAVMLSGIEASFAQISVIGHKSAFAPASASSVTIAKPSGVLQNDFLLAHISGRVISSFALLPPSNGWTLLSKMNTGSQFGTHIFYKVASSSEPSSYTFTDSTGVMLYDKLGAISVFRGADAPSPIETAADSICFSSPSATPSITTVTDSCLIITLFSDGSGSSWTPPAGMIEEYDTAAAQSSWVSIACDYMLMSPAGSTGQKIALGSASGTTAQIIALKKSSAPTFIAENNPEAISVTMFPNPSSGKFQLSVIGNPLSVSDIYIYNVMGEKVYSEKILTPKSLLLNLDAPDGIYFYKIISNENRQTSSGKLIIE